MLLGLPQILVLVAIVVNHRVPPVVAAVSGPAHEAGTLGVAVGRA
jgi:hypothetical protein